MKKYALASVFALVACGSQPPAAPTAAPATAVVAPNANLMVQGIPPIPASLVDQVAKYTDFRGHGFADWHPQRREMLVSHRKGGANTNQLFRLTEPGGVLEQLTDSADPVTTASYEPREGKYAVFERSSGGSEADQLYRLDLDTKQAALITDPAERHNLQGWLHRSSVLLTASLPLDKTAQSGTRAKVTTTFRLMNPLKPEAARKVAELDGGGWYAGGISSDDKRVALTRYISATESQVWVLDIASGRATQVLPAPGSRERATYFAGEFTQGNNGLLVISDRAGEFRELMAYRFANKLLTRMSSHIRWDVSSVATTEDGRIIAAQFNVEGKDELRLFDGKTLKELRQPVTPPGSVGSASFHRRTGELAFSLNSAQGPSQLFSLEVGGQPVPWTQPYAAPGVDMKAFQDQSIVRWKSFDGRSISGLMNLPPAQFTGKRPVMVLIHGGPEAQATVGFMGRYNYYINELGMALIQPNVRGSSGFGKSFLSLDDGMKREDSVKDIGALLDWIATQPELDASKVIVSGGSYGGYMSLAVSTHYADRIAGSIDVVGISNFVTFLQNTESYRRDLRRVEYGDERTPAMRAFLEKISPLTNAGRITKPLFVVQGKNDPRVPYTEAEQIVAKARSNGTPVWYLRAENEGHGFARKENADYQFYATVLFLQTTIGK
ncbi:MAG TPA: prolyl oligopeptidase family serine peptidase [Rhizobacter sp.]|nr:prolyl oligopeptidase family serine peptidase [Rhizobacter sp.]